jgi:apolipoprotein N-acyltransferase
MSNITLLHYFLVFFMLVTICPLGYFVEGIKETHVKRNAKYGGLVGIMAGIVGFFTMHSIIKMNFDILLFFATLVFVLLMAISFFIGIKIHNIRHK